MHMSYGRLRLTQFYEAKLTVGHAFEIARLQPLMRRL